MEYQIYHLVDYVDVKDFSPVKVICVDQIEPRQNKYNCYLNRIIALLLTRAHAFNHVHFQESYVSHKRRKALYVNRKIR